MSVHQRWMLYSVQHRFSFPEPRLLKSEIIKQPSVICAKVNHAYPTLFITDGESGTFVPGGLTEGVGAIEEDEKASTEHKEEV